VGGKEHTGKGDTVLQNDIRLALGRVFAIGLLAAANGCGGEPPAPPPLEIPFVSVELKDVSIPLDVVGETIGSTDVTIRARVEGFLDGIHFQEGAFVDEGALLYTIDSQPFEAKLAQANAAQAQSHSELAKAKSDLNRIRPLAEMRAVSEQELDSAVANFEAAQSFVEAAKAQVELARIELGYTRIHAPVHGLIGLTEAQVGDFVSQSSNGGLLNVVSRTDPIAVRVSVAEQAYLVAARRIGAQQEPDLGAEGRAPLTLILADGSIYEHQGFVTKVDRNIDASTGSLTGEAEFPNPANILRPGMFARVRFDADRIEDAVLVPQRAVNELQSAYRVFVIKPDDTVEVRQVKVGQRLGSEWIIESGLEAGERIAVAGLLRLRAGMMVVPKPAEAADLPPTAVGRDA
jgi:membrane fusion protein (multidrug efflux system)